MLGNDRDERLVPTEAERQALALGWGIGWPWPDWPWTTDIRILCVIDGRVTESSDPSEFGLGLVLETLRDASFAYWVRFIVTVVDRDQGFNFTQSGLDINGYDEVWFFGDEPGPVVNDSSVGDDVIKVASNHPMQSDELQVIAKWMNDGGGVFAAGDHAMLGASMCGEIPRVRSMRRWTRADGVPPFSEPARHETLARRSTGSEATWEEDAVPQPIYPVPRSDWGKPLFFRHWPHPLLCGKEGVIDHFPDHMHEGSLYEDDEVHLTDPLLPGSTEAEYPPYRPVVLAAAIPGSSLGGGESFELRPAPEIIAHGMTTNIDATPRRFAMVGVYDGDPVNVGRVVVESTWHHWFSLNLVPLRNGAPATYRQMQSYYRNVGLWLASPAKRASMLFWATWGVLVGSQPGLFGTSLGVWGMGSRVVDVLGRAAPQCFWSDLVSIFLPTQVLTAESRRESPPWDSVLRPPAEMVTEAVVGGIALGMYELAQHHIIERAHGRAPRIEPDDVWERGINGLRKGTEELQATLAIASEGFRRFAKQPLDDRIAAFSRMPADPRSDWESAK
jgi:hypothetical protein